MFQLTEAQANFHHLNVRKEKHGPEEVGACDLRFTLTAPNEKLDELMPGLRTALWDPDEDPDLADQANGARLTKLKFVGLEPIKMALQLANQQVKLHYGVQGNDIVLADCKINEFCIEPKEGGSVEIKFRVQAHPDEGDVGRLYGMLKGNQILSTKSEAV